MWIGFPRPQLASEAGNQYLKWGKGGEGVGEGGDCL